MAARKTMATIEPKTKEGTPKKTEATPAVKTKKFSNEDRIPCFSITSGKYLFVGDKSGDLYRWLNDGDVVDVRYDDLVAAVRTRKPAVFKPRFIIKDKDFIAQFSQVKDLYDSLYSLEDLRSILTLPADKMKTVINSLPEGAKESLRDMAMSAIDSGNLDSVQRVRVLDEIYGTNMLLKLTD